MNEATADEFIYNRIAAEFQQQIMRNLLKPGDKLPSLRALSSEQGISIGTAYKTYMELENMGLVQSRSKSGYYVTFASSKFAIAPAAKPPLKKTQPVNVGSMVQMVYENLSDERILHLSLAAPDAKLRPVPQLNKSLLEALRASASGNTHYENQEGHPALRKQIAKNAYKWGGKITENEVITTHGCMEALLFSLRAVTKTGDVVAIESPAYFGVFNIMLHLGLQVLEIPVDAENGIDIEYLEKEMAHIKIAACLFISNFNNPTGSCMPDHRKQQLENY